MPRTGAKLWSYPTGAGGFLARVANGVVYVGSCDDNLYALDASTGTQRWVYSAGTA